MCAFFTPFSIEIQGSAPNKEREREKEGGRSGEALLSFSLLLCLLVRAEFAYRSITGPAFQPTGQRAL